MLYVLDGNAYFHHAVVWSRSLAYKPALTDVDPAIIVGLGYPDAADFDLDRRTLDYTPPVSHATLQARPNGDPWPETGGAAAFLAFVEQVVKPRIESEYPVDRARQALFGHSFGGLFTLYSAFTAPHLFRSFLASSPSIWFGDGAVLKYETDFRERLRALGQRRDLFVSIGSEEQTVAPERQAAVGAAWTQWVGDCRMVDQARDLAARLGACAPDGLDLTFQMLDGENHATAPLAAMARAIRIGLKSVAPHAAHSDD